MLPELVAAVATVVAHTLWSVALGGARVESRGMFVDKEADDLFRVDLRNVPAVRARVGVVDRVFTRVGAADDLPARRAQQVQAQGHAALVHRWRGRDAQEVLQPDRQDRLVGRVVDLGSATAR